MKKLLVFDDKNYTDDMPLVEKQTVRGVIVRDGKIAVQKGTAGECKILGGGVEENENFVDALYREVLEESGLFIKKDKVKELGTITEIREDLYTKGIKYICHSNFYLCEIEQESTEAHMTKSELDKGYHLEWVPFQEMVACNQAFLHLPWIKRDTAFVEMMVEHKIDVVGGRNA